MRKITLLISIVAFLLFGMAQTSQAQGLKGLGKNL